MARLGTNGHRYRGLLVEGFMVTVVLTVVAAVVLPQLALAAQDQPTAQRSVGGSNPEPEAASDGRTLLAVGRVLAED